MLETTRTSFDEQRQDRKIQGVKLVQVARSDETLVSNSDSTSVRPASDAAPVPGRLQSAVLTGHLELSLPLTALDAKKMRAFTSS